MHGPLWQVPLDVRSDIVAALRERDLSLTEDAAAVLDGTPGLDARGWRECAGAAVRLFATAIEAGELDDRRGALHDLCRFSPPAPVRQIVRSIHAVERVILDELAIHESIGATSESWPLVAHAVRSAAFEITAAYAERDGGRPAVRDQLTTLMSAHVFRLALEQETARANRHEHGISALLFDIDDLSALNDALGYGAGDRLLERLGILARRFFRNHDWVARHGEDSIAVLLPEATLDQAAALANRFREMVQQRIVLTDHKTDIERRVTVSAAAVGTDRVQVDIDAGYIVSELEAAVLRAKLNGGNRTETVALLPTSVTILGAATLLGTGTRQVIELIREGALRATRRGRHYHIDRIELEEVKRAREA
ncbi:MAG TPA: diguanylate cyclase [Vicinamibacterales bacterium]|nr:diguanylate cyclase [Vicinamibacterales bacterium]